MSRKLAGSIVPPWLLATGDTCVQGVLWSCLPQDFSHALDADKDMAGPTGIKPATSRLTIWRPKPG